MKNILDRLFSRSSWRVEIMRQFERPPYFFPMFNPADWSFARARLSVFRSDIEWLIVFEIFGYNLQAVLFETQACAFGNKVRRQNHITNKDAIILFNEVGKPLLEQDERNLDPTNFWGEVDGKLYHFTPTLADYAELGIDLVPDTPDENEYVAEILILTKTLRYIAYKFPELVFYQPSELLKDLKRPETLPLFLQTFDRYHPYWKDKDDTPSNSPCLQSLAVALEENNISAFQCPQSISNTHWSKWPEWNLDVYRRISSSK